MIMNVKPRSSCKDSSNTTSKTQVPSYLRGGQSDKTIKNLKHRYTALVKRVAPTDLDFEQNKINESHNMTLQNTIVVSQGLRGHHPNDITNSQFNPVIQKIKTFMERKEAKNATNSPLNKLSFLSIRSIW